MNHDKYNLRSAFFDEADMVIALFDKDLNYIDVNQNYLKIFHFKREDIIGKNITYTSPDVKTTGRFEQYMEVLRTGKTLIIEEMKPHASLGNFHFQIKAFKLGDCLGTITKDVTDLVETIDELETFIYKSSHDMRSPIASILGLLDLVDTSAKTLEEAQQYSRIVKHQTDRLDKILKILIETTRIRKGAKIIHLINFNDIVDEVLNSLAFTKYFDKIKFEKNISVPGKFYSDKLLVISLFQNLIENAIKYKHGSSRDSFIKISVTSESDGVIIVIEDNGIGIPENLQKDVFKMFFRATDKASGSGLGLYTVNHTIKKLGGYINLKSTEKVGTTFTIYLPNEKPVVEG